MTSPSDNYKRNKRQPYLNFMDDFLVSVQIESGIDASKAFRRTLSHIVTRTLSPCFAFRAYLF